MRPAYAVIWGGRTGRLVEHPPKRSKNLASHYILARTALAGSGWCCVGLPEGVVVVKQAIQRRKWHVRSRRTGIAAGVAVVLVALVALAAAAFYVFGGGGGKAAAGPVTAPTLAPTKNGTIFTIDSSGSQATFTMHEVLFGNLNTVVGTTRQVAGQILVDTKDPSQSQIGEIKVDLSTLATDNNLRNNTIQNRILETAQPGNQYATFVATSLKGLPATVAIGQTVSFQITGNLTLHGVTKAVSFDTQVTLKSATELTGKAQTTVRYSDFNIVVPNVPSVTGLSDTATLALTFAASA
jgi:polyisoprenoid-binding protein YceI